MLVISRRANQTIVLPGLDITVTILETHRGKSVIGINAPNAIRIVRGEQLDGNSNLLKGTANVSTIDNESHADDKTDGTAAASTAESSES